MSSLTKTSMSNLSTLGVRWLRMSSSVRGNTPTSKVPWPTPLQVCLLLFACEVMTDQVEIFPKGKAQYKAGPTDIWALGLLLSMILTRNMPFVEGSEKYRFQLSSEVPGPAYEIMRACLRIDPDDRPKIDDIADHYWLSEQYIRDLARRRR